MKQLNKYYRQIKGWLPGGRMKKILMAQIKANVQEYIDANPGIGFPAVQTHFGTPQQIAAAFVEEMDMQELLRMLRVRRRVVGIVLTAVIAALTIYGLAILAILIYNLGGYDVISGPY